ncbi:protein SLOW GREEN 1, chloroplastic [Cicer arietinum]|uniref:Protein SLOW GREEN 1, chloroplastic isoform X2 n=1 Tax=Cicer arietinum TaxID=3827 RepID=A0A1S2YDN9_CICAR|nr:protein SLOW GREEN 1, chloroplastic isoform X2 [Cicer arietinum]
MTSTATTTFFIYSKFPNSLLRSRIHTCNKPFSLSLPPSKLRATHLSVCTCSRTPFTPSTSFSPQRSLSKFISEKIAFFLIGSFIFFGCFNTRTAFAIAVPPSGGVLEEKEKSDEDAMNERILEKDPRNVEGLKVIVYGKIRRGKCKEAEKFVKRLIDVEPNEVEWRLLLALCYETMGYLSKAKTLYSEILEHRPLLVRALHSLAMVMHKNNEGPAVFEMLNKALELAISEDKVTEERNIRILTAQMLVVQGDLEEGLKRFQDLIDQNPRDFRPYLCQGIIYSLLDKKEEAAKQFETYQALVPEEFPQRGFLDDITIQAKGTSRVQFQKEFGNRFSDQK